ncbi:hypothetical protein Q7P35_002096 [Cladosporium inversicolor]
MRCMPVLRDIDGFAPINAIILKDREDLRLHIGPFTLHAFAVSPNLTMSWYYPSSSPWHIPMAQPRLTSHERLMAWINHTSTGSLADSWERIERLPFSDAELDSATERALELYTKWLAEDIRRLWPLLGSGRTGQAALEVLQDASVALKGFAEDSGVERAYALAMIPRFSPNCIDNYFTQTQACSEMLSRTRSSRDPRTLLFDLIDERVTEHEFSEWDRVQAAVLNGSLPRAELLEALDWAVWRFSAILTSKLHDNFMASIKSTGESMSEDLQSRMSFHQEWCWKLSYLPHLAATLKTCENEHLFMGIKEMVGDRRAVNMGLIRYAMLSTVAQTGS